MRPLPSPFNQETTRRLERVPALRALVVAAQNRIRAEEPNGLWSCEAEFSDLLHPDPIREILLIDLEHVVTEPSYLPSGSQDSSIIVRDDQFSLSLKLFRPGPPIERAEIYGLREQILMGIVGPTPLSIAVFREKSGYVNAVFDRTRVIEGPEHRTLQPGDFERLYAGRDCVVHHNPTTPTLALFMATSPTQRLQWTYDTIEKRAVRAVAANPASSRLEFAAQTLAEFGDESSISALQGLYEHPDHFVRWTAIRTLARIDRDSGLALVRKAVGDSHPHVRNAALRALQKLA